MCVMYLKMSIIPTSTSSAFSPIYSKFWPYNSFGDIFI